MTTEADFGVRLLQVKEHRGWMEALGSWETKEGFFSRSRHFGFESRPPELGENQFLLFEAAKFAGICYSRPGT